MSDAKKQESVTESGLVLITILPDPKPTSDTKFWQSGDPEYATKAMVYAVDIESLAIDWLDRQRNRSSRNEP